MGSLTSERIDSTNTAISLVQSLHSVQNTFCFLTDKAFCSCLWAFFLFSINSTFNLGPGAIACTKGVIFIYFFRRAKASAKQARSLFPRRACLALLVRLALAFAKFSDFFLGYTYTASFSIKYTIASMVCCSPLPNLFSFGWLQNKTRGIGAG